MNCSICERPARVFRAVRRYSSRSAKARKPTSLKNHDLCMRCWERLTDSIRAAQLAQMEKEMYQQA